LLAAISFRVLPLPLGPSVAPASLPLYIPYRAFPRNGRTVDMRNFRYTKIVLLTIIALLAACACISNAGAATPATSMSAHLWVNGLPQGQLIVVTVADHVQINYVGGQGRYDFPIAGTPGEVIQVSADGKLVQSFAYNAGVSTYLNWTYEDGAITAYAYNAGDPMPTPYAVPTLTPEPRTEHTSIGLDGTWIIAVSAMLSLVFVGCVATVRRKIK
jgi:hypothetical protein